jgi:hypothetical protein
MQLTQLDEFPEEYFANGQRLHLNDPAEENVPYFRENQFSLTP